MGQSQRLPTEPRIEINGLQGAAMGNAAAATIEEA
jgi:hypothetical protein